MKSIFLGILLITLSACGKTVYVDRVKTVLVPTPQPCVSNLPEEVKKLKEEYPNFKKFDIKQKSAAIGKKALEHKTYGEQLKAGTANCPIIE
jgi:hypothetical protein